MIPKTFLVLGLSLFAVPSLAALPAPDEEPLQGCERQGAIVYSQECLLPAPASSQLATPAPANTDRDAAVACNADTLSTAAYRGDLKTLHRCRPSLRELARAATDTASRGRTPLHWAVAGGRADTVTHLIEAGAPLSAAARGDRGAQPLHLAAEAGMQEVATLLLEAGAPLEGRDLFGYTPLHRAAAAGQGAMIEQLLDAGARVDARDRTGKTPLMLAARGHHPRALALLLSRGANPGATSRQGQSALDYGEGHALVVKQLLAAGSASQDTLPELAQEGVERHWPQIEESLSRGPAPPASELQELLSLSVEQTHLPLFRLLLNRGADPGELRLGDFQHRSGFLRQLLEEGLLDPAPTAARGRTQAEDNDRDRG